MKKYIIILFAFVLVCSFALAGPIVSRNPGGSGEIKLTNLGGIAIRLTNETGFATVAGQLVKADTATNEGAILAGIGDTECIGVFLDSGITDGSLAWVVVGGIAYVAFDDNRSCGSW